MGRKKNKYPLLENVKIQNIAAEGKAIAKVDDLVIFVPFAAPGDIVDIQINKKKHNYAEGYIVNTHTYSEERVEPFCSHFGYCGGCKMQHIPYSSQLKYKEQQVIDALTRIGKVSLPEKAEHGDQKNRYPSTGFYPIMGSAKTKFYRNKLEFTFSNRRWMTYEEMREDNENSTKNTNALGFHIPRMFDKIIDIEKCWLQDDISNKIRLSVREFCNKNSYEFFDLKKQAGLMRNMIIRTSSTGEIMVIIVFFDDNKDKIEALMKYLSEKFPEITALLYVINKKANDTIADQDINVYNGRGFIFEKMETLQFKIGPKSFYQTNSEQAYELYKVARTFADLNEDDLVYDLYTGTGTIAQFLSGKCKKVIGIEYVPEAIEDAKENAKLNNISNADFYAGDMKDILSRDFIEENGNPDVIITDPPRAGMHQDVIDTILYAAPKKIVYISCNPATQARDLSELCKKYEIDKVQPVDLFPHTHHIENVVLLKEKINVV